MTIEILQVDAFTDRAFAGNPAAVCFLDAPRDDEWMQLVAREMNLSETAFVVPRSDPDEGHDLRWFTPELEVELCGHATLASAHALWETGRLAPQVTARFTTASGVLTCEQRGPWILMDFPADRPERTEATAEISAALGVPIVEAGRSRLYWMAALESSKAVREVQPDLERVAALPKLGLIVTAPGRPPYDFVSRFFAPRAGVDEDPVTGSAHCVLAPYWSARLGRPELVGYQASARGGVVRVRDEGQRVTLGGRAVTVLRGELF